MGVIANEAKRQGKTERQLVIEALTSGRSIEGAAKLLGIYPNAIRSKMSKHRLKLVREIIVRVIEEQA